MDVIQQTECFTKRVAMETRLIKYVVLSSLVRLQADVTGKRGPCSECHEIPSLVSAHFVSY